MRIPETVFLFDDDDYERASRQRDLEAALRLLRARSGEGAATASAAPRIVATGSRRTLFSQLDKQTEPSILIADLFNARFPLDSGWIGARILRSVAEDRVLARRCWRVALTKHATAEISTELDGFAHALVKDGPSQVVSNLLHAIVDSIAQPLDRMVPIRTYPVTDDKRDWDVSVQKELHFLVGEDAMRGDEFILRQLVRGVPANVIDDALQRDVALAGHEQERRTSVTAFMNAVRVHRQEAGTPAVRRLIAGRGGGVVGETIYQGLDPTAVERAATAVQALALDANAYRVHRLQEDVLAAAKEFILLYRAALENPRSNSSSGWMAQGRALETFSGDENALEYAIWSLSDVIFGADEW